MDIERIQPPGSPIRLDESNQIRRVLSAFRAYPHVTDFQMGMAGAKITVHFATGEQAIYVVSQTSWQRGSNSHGRLASTWHDLLAGLNTPDDGE